MWLILIVSLIIVLTVAFFYTKMTRLKIKDEVEIYKCKDYLLTKTEKSAFDKIQQAIKQSNLPFMVLPKLRLTDFLWTPKENRNAYLKIQSKFVDFLVVKKPHLHPAFAVFIINEENKPKMQSLETIEPTLNTAGIKLIKINAKEVFSDDFLNLIKEELKWQYQKNY